jgi:glycosyltransferase involved in cell wall biosynthesis
LIKAFDTVIKKNNDDKKIHLVIAGPYEKSFYIKMINLINDLKLDKFATFTGPLYNKLKWDAFNSCQIFCLPTHQENFGITIAESLSVGKPIITTNKTNIWKILKSYNAGFISNDDYNGLVKSLIKWNLLKKNEYKRMSKNSLKCFRENFYKDTVVKDLKRILKN